MVLRGKLCLQERSPLEIGSGRPALQSSGAHQIPEAAFSAAPQHNLRCCGMESDVVWIFLKGRQSLRASRGQDVGLHRVAQAAPVDVCQDNVCHSTPACNQSFRRRCLGGNGADWQAGIRFGKQSVKGTRALTGRNLTSRVWPGRCRGVAVAELGRATFLLVPASI